MSVASLSDKKASISFKNCAAKLVIKDDTIYSTYGSNPFEYWYIELYLPKYTVPFKLTLDKAALELNIVSPNNDVFDPISLLDLYPNVNGFTSIELAPSDLGLDWETWHDGYYKMDFTFRNQNGAVLEDYTVSDFYYNIEELCCCISKMKAKLANSCCACDEELMCAVVKAEILLDVLQAKAKHGDVDKSDEVYSAANKLCSTDCKCK